MSDPVDGPSHYPHRRYPAYLDDEEEQSQDDMLDQILENYNFICEPEIRLKFKQRVGHFAVGFAVAKPWLREHRLRFTLKPTPEAPGWLSKTVQKLLVVPTLSQVYLFSNKLNFRWLTLRFMAGYNWERMKPTLDYRITTKWSDGPRIRRKEQYQVLKPLKLCCKWNLDYHLPDMEGHLGADDLDLNPIDVDFGRLNFEISQLDVVVDLSKLGKGRCSSGSSGSSTCSIASAKASKAGSTSPGGGSCNASEASSSGRHSSGGGSGSSADERQAMITGSRCSNTCSNSGLAGHTELSSSSGPCSSSHRTAAWDLGLQTPGASSGGQLMAYGSKWFEQLQQSGQQLDVGQWMKSAMPVWMHGGFPFAAGSKSSGAGA